MRNAHRLHSEEVKKLPALIGIPDRLQAILLL
mgnify:CR=1 FL=1